MKPETALRQRVERVMSNGGIGVEPVESGAVNTGFPDLLLSVFGADGLIPLELKIGYLDPYEKIVRISYRADQMAKQYELRRRLRHAWTLIYVLESKTYYLIRDYRAAWEVTFLKQHSKWYDTDLNTLASRITDLVSKRENRAISH